MLTFTGGEPTLREDICKLIGYSSWFVTRLNTNGTLLDESFCRSLREASLDSLQITLYSHDKEIHNSLVGAPLFEKTVEGIKNALEAGLDVSVNTPLCRKNADYLETLRFLSSLGVRFVTVSGLICTGMAEEKHGDYDLSSDELYGALKEAKQFCSENRMEIDFTSPGLIEDEKLYELEVEAEDDEVPAEL